jgi:asparagine synthase (glutamine-hydrolysing)
MCGITGGIGTLAESTLRNMVQKMAHRGPDNQDWLSEDNVHLGHVRLSIIDLSPKSNQPLWDVNKQAAIVFNGEIYNYQSLRDELIEAGLTFNSGGDAEVLLNLYLHYGPAGLSKLEGMFSFCIWDKAKKQLVLARDTFGVKPLYYTSNEDGFFFASEIKSLLELPTIDKSLSHEALMRSLVFLYSPGETTLIKSIKKLKPGHVMTVSEFGVEEYARFWSWPAYKPKEDTLESYTQSVLSAVQTAVDSQLVADVKVGSFLSGGLDSSLLVAMASKENDIPCFTIDTTGGKKGVNDGFEDDLPYAKKVAEHLNTELNVLSATPDIVKQLPEMIYHLDELQADPAPLNVMMICEDAKNKGIKVLLSGAGGDDVFSGYRRHVAIQFERYWRGLPKFMRSGLRAITQSLPKRSASLRRIAKAFKYADLSESERLLSYFYWIDPEVVRGLFKPSIQMQLAKQPMQFMLDELNALDCPSPLEKMLHVERNYFLVDHNFNYTDKMSMSKGVEVRVPFLDKGVAELASTLPDRIKQKGKQGKWILKKAAEALLPKSIIYRPKSGFGAPLRTWLHNDLAPMVDSLLSDKTISARGVFEPDKVRALIDADRAGREDYSYPIFALLCFEIWCQTFID